MKNSCGESRQDTVTASKHTLTILLAASVFAVAHVSYAAGRVFFDDFESGNTSKWTSASAVVVNSPRDGGPGPHGGSKMLECNSNGTVAWNDPIVYTSAYLESWPYSQEILLRAWVRYDADVDNVFGNKILRLGKYPQQSFYLQGTTNGEMLAYFEQIEGVNGPSKYFPGAILNRQWHKFEVYIKHNTTGQTNGIFRAWWNGTKIIDAANLKTVGVGGNWTQLNLQSNWALTAGPHDTNNHVYWDNIEIFSDLGSGGVGSMADATMTATLAQPLPAPQNLR